MWRHSLKNSALIMKKFLMFLAFAIAFTSAIAQQQPTIDGLTGEQWFKKNPNKYLERAAELEYPKAQYQLAQKKENTDGRAAFNLYQKSAQKGFAPAQCKMGEYYLMGSDYAKANNSKAYEWFKKSADQNYALGEYYYAMCYLDGIGVAPDTIRGMKLLQSAAEKGVPDAQNDLAVHYYFGLYTKQDYQKSAEWIQKAAAQGNVQGISGLGECYYYGRGVKQNYKKAFKLFTKAAEKRSAQFFLGECYYYGNGVKQDRAKAIEYYKKSAAEGYSRAQTRLNELNK